MVRRRVNKFLFLAQVLLVTSIVALFALVVFQKDSLVEEFCECPPCDFQVESPNSSLWDDLVDAFCACPSCD